MIVVSPALDVILDFVGEQNGTKSNLRWSSFSFKIYEGSNILLFNTLTKELLSLTSEKELEGS
ncbi:MAG: hypothetical protein J5663_04825, partial [Bacteroidaceae bacterium]|nr:hypothetical protein [Bacteroidaceae bacterium]